MKVDMEWVANDLMLEKDMEKTIYDFSRENIEKVRCFYKGLSNYMMTPLHNLSNLAKHMGVKNIYVKDESYRMGLNSFKVLGSCYAIAKLISKRVGKDFSQITFEGLKGQKVKEIVGDITFISATDGNHGRAVAWTARELNQKAIIYMPKGSSQRRVDNIEELGAAVKVTDKNYNETVRMAIDDANRYGWEIVQDTAWDGYEKIPLDIMQGYGLMALEAIDQLDQQDLPKPTHIFIQAGVGSMGGAVTGFFSSEFLNNQPVITVVEPEKANCIFKSMRKGSIDIVDGDMDTIMAGLACGEPNPIGWEIISKCCKFAVSVPECYTAYGMRILGNPLLGDARVISGESGAVTMGVLGTIMKDQKYEELRNKLKLNKNSSILLFSTEGDTDPDFYRNIVWKGLYNCKE